MAIPKVMGTEIEYGITVKNDRDFDPISSCVLLVNSYREKHISEILWDYDQEDPLSDARGFHVEGERYTPNQQENIARNKTLANGARYYVDHAHPEILLTPEVADPRETLVHLRPKAGELDHPTLEWPRGQQRCSRRIPRSWCSTRTIPIGKGNSYGSARELSRWSRRHLRSDRIVRTAARRFFVTRQIFCGGRQGGEPSCPASAPTRCDYQTHPARPTSSKTEVGLETTLKRPIINTRDEPHADARQVPPTPRDRRRRQSMSETSIYLSQGRHDRSRARHGRGWSAHPARL